MLVDRWDYGALPGYNLDSTLACPKIKKSVAPRHFIQNLLFDFDSLNLQAVINKSIITISMSCASSFSITPRP